MLEKCLARAKRKDNGEWVVGYYVCESNHACFKSELKYRHYILKDVFMDFNLGGLQEFEIIPETVGRFTGLRDDKRTSQYPSGQMIFEGDVVNFKTTAYHFKNCQIEYQDCYARYCAVDESGCKYPMDKTFKYEIIGNVYDNPELLEGGVDNA